jgi:calcium-dependent protein kinase
MGGCLSRGGACGGADFDNAQPRGFAKAAATPASTLAAAASVAPSSAVSYDYAAYAEALLAHGGSPPGSSSSASRRRRFPPRRHDHHSGGGGSPASGGASPERSRAARAAARAAATPFGPRPDVTRPLARSLLGKAYPDDVAALYEPGHELGRGQFGVARLARCRSTGGEVAIKSISKRHLEQCSGGKPPGGGSGVDVRREVEVLRHLSPHPRIVRLIDALEDECSVHLVLELCRGGELVDAVEAAGRFTEKDAAAAMRALLEAVAFCHEMGVCHRDLKLDNLLIADDGGGGGGGGGRDSLSSPHYPGSCSTTTASSSLSQRVSRIKANDFGLSTFVRDGERLRGLCGTAFYVAPEILAEKDKRGYCGKRADIWSCGVILYIMLSGQPPFYADRDEDVFRQILAAAAEQDSSSSSSSGGPFFGGRVWDSVSTAAIEAVCKMMRKDPAERPTAAEMLQDPWVREGGLASGDRPLQPEVLRRMRAFATHNRLKREAMLLVAESLPAEEIVGLRALFDDYDADGDGMITPAELRAGLLRKQGAMSAAAAAGGGDNASSAAADAAALLPLEALERIVALADVDNDHRMSVDEFIASTLSVQRAGLRRRLEAAFERFDADGDGYATRGEVRAALAALQGRRRRQRLREAEAAAAAAAAAASNDDARDRDRDRDRDHDHDHGDDDDAAASDELAALTHAELSSLKTDVEAIFAEADRDGDGRISREEFLAMMMADSPLGDDGPGEEAEDAAEALLMSLGGGINRRSLAAARRSVAEEMKQRQQQQQQQQEQQQQHQQQAVARVPARA